MAGPETRVVICDFDGRKRLVLFASCEDAAEENKNLVTAAKSVFSDVISTEKEDSYFVQVDSGKYGLIDVTSSSAHVAENDTVFLHYWKHPEDEVSGLVWNKLLPIPPLCGKAFRRLFRTVPELVRPYNNKCMQATVC